MELFRNVISGEEWEDYGKHLEFLTHHDEEDHQCRLVMIGKISLISR